MTGGHTGSVAQFDAHVGRGVVLADDGVEYGFHCVAIADGSRTIALGAHVDFDLIPGPLGRWEAANIRPHTQPGWSRVPANDR